MVIECVFRPLLLARPDQSLMGIAEAHTSKIRHRIGLYPDHIIQYPETKVLHQGTKTVDIMVGSNHPYCPCRLKKPPGFLKPASGKTVILLKTPELIPGIIHGIHTREVWPVEFLP